MFVEYTLLTHMLQALQDLMTSRQHSVPGLSLDVALFQTADGEERIAEAELPPIVVV